ncbi:MAG: hypothetical protein RR290_04740 [Clostridia bacterium]
MNFFEQCKNRYSIFDDHCKKVTDLVKEDVKFVTLQCDESFSSPQQIVDILMKISDFYNENWLGNADYIHIPTFKQVYENYLKYPIILAYREILDEIEILGVTTIKRFNNNKNINPYCPISGNMFFEVTGIIAKKESDIKGIGKRLYEIAIEASKDYKTIFPSLELIVVADCRNFMSVSAAGKGAAYVRNIYETNTFAKMIGYYTVEDTNHELVEAPTFVIKYDLTPSKLIEGNPIIFDYNIEDELFNGLLNTINDNLKPFFIKEPTTNIDFSAGIVKFYELNDKNLNIEDVILLPNGTDKNNDRTPWVRKRVKREMKLCIEQ